MLRGHSSYSNITPKFPRVDYGYVGTRVSHRFTLASVYLTHKIAVNSNHFSYPTPTSRGGHELQFSEIVLLVHKCNEEVTNFNVYQRFYFFINVTRRSRASIVHPLFDCFINFTRRSRTSIFINVSTFS